MEDMLLSARKPDAERSFCADVTEAHSTLKRSVAFSIFLLATPPVLCLESPQLFLRKARDGLLLSVFCHGDHAEKFSGKGIPSTLVL